MVSNGPLVIQTPYVVYVLCRVRPNARDEVKDKMCNDVHVIAPTSALLISNRQIQAACVILTIPSRLTLNLKHALSTMCFFCCLCWSWYNYVDYVLIWWTMFVVWTVSTMWTLWTKFVVYELCELDVICYVGHVLFVNLWPMLGIYELLYGMYHVSIVFLC